MPLRISFRPSEHLDSEYKGRLPPPLETFLVQVRVGWRTLACLGWVSLGISFGTPCTRLRLFVLLGRAHSATSYSWRDNKTIHCKNFLPPRGSRDFTVNVRRLVHSASAHVGAALATSSDFSNLGRLGLLTGSFMAPQPFWSTRNLLTAVWSFFSTAWLDWRPWRWPRRSLPAGRPCGKRARSSWQESRGRRRYLRGSSSRHPVGDFS